MAKVEKMRQAILEGINLTRPPPPPPPLPPPAFLPPTMVPPFYPMPPLYPPRPLGGMPPHHHPHPPHHPAQHRPRAFPGLLPPVFQILCPRLHPTVPPSYCFDVPEGVSTARIWAETSPPTSGTSGSPAERSFIIQALVTSPVVFLSCTFRTHSGVFPSLLQASNQSLPRGGNWRLLEWLLASGLGTNRSVDEAV